MKYLLWALALPLTLALVLLAVQTLASERVEVVELTTTDASGEAITTRLWVVDDEGYQYLRVGEGGSGWFTRIQENPEFSLQRGGVTASYTAVQRPDKSRKINDLMYEKYTWGDDFFAAVLGGREGSIPIELHALN